MAEVFTAKERSLLAAIKRCEVVNVASLAYVFCEKTKQMEKPELDKIIDRLVKAGILTMRVAENVVALSPDWKRRV